MTQLQKLLELRKRFDKAMKGNKDKPFPKQAPIQRSLRIRNKQAEALLRSNLRSGAKPAEPSAFTTGTTKKITSGGMSSAAEITTHGRGKSTFDHMIDFGRDNVDVYDRYEPRYNASAERKRLRSANYQYQAAQLMDDVKTGDSVSAIPIESDSGNNTRDRVYSRMSRGALAGEADDFGEVRVFSRRTGQDSWENIKGEKKKWDPKQLKKGLMKAAAGKIVQRLAGPYAQAAIFADELAGSALGERPSVTVGKGFKKTRQKEIEERLRRGQRVIPMGLGF